LKKKLSKRITGNGSEHLSKLTGSMDLSRTHARHEAKK
jgi:hypothetical protein